MFKYISKRFYNKYYSKINTLKQLEAKLNFTK